MILGYHSRSYNASGSGLTVNKQTQVDLPICVPGSEQRQCYQEPALRCEELGGVVNLRTFTLLGVLAKGGVCHSQLLDRAVRGLVAAVTLQVAMVN